MTALIPILRRQGLLGRPNRDLGRLFEDFDLPTLISGAREFMPAFDVSETEKS